MDRFNETAKLEASRTGLGQDQPNLLQRHENRRHELEMELYKVRNSIEFVRKNQALVEVVEIVLASRDKCDPRPYGL